MRPGQPDSRRWVIAAAADTGHTHTSHSCLAQKPQQVRIEPVAIAIERQSGLREDSMRDLVLLDDPVIHQRFVVVLQRQFP
jgi:hypothetical protein